MYWARLLALAAINSLSQPELAIQNFNDIAADHNNKFCLRQIDESTNTF